MITKHGGQGTGEKYVIKWNKMPKAKGTGKQNTSQQNKRKIKIAKTPTKGSKYEINI